MAVSGNTPQQKESVVHRAHEKGGKTDLVDIAVVCIYFASIFDLLLFLVPMDPLYEVSASEKLIRISQQGGATETGPPKRPRK